MPDASLVNIIRHGEEELISLTRPFEMLTQRCDGTLVTACQLRPGYLRSSELSMQHRTRQHYHDYFELMFVLEGELIQHIEQGVYHYHQGDACLLGRNARHRERFDSAFHIVFLNLSPAFVQELLGSDELIDADGNRTLADGVIRRFLRQELDGTACFERGYLDFTPTLAAPTGCAQAERLLDQLGEELLAQQPGSNLLVRGLLARLFGQLEDPTRYHAVHMRPDSRTEDMLVARVTNYLQERNGRVSREELAAALHYHPTYLNQLVKARTGQSILQLGQHLCIRQAQTLLRETNLPVAQIAQTLGYHNRTYFYRIFQEETGTTPAQWRARHAGK